MKYLSLALIIISLLLGSCKSKFQKALKNPDIKTKLEVGEYFFKKKDYYRAQSLFDQIENEVTNTALGERVLFYQAQCDFGLKAYSLAGYRYKIYYETYPTNANAEEALYMNAYCIYLESQDVELDQTDTYKAVETFKIFVSVYPDSKYVEECNKYLDKLRAKLSQKAYNNAKLYYNIGEYRSAIVALRNVVNDFPEVPQREEIDYLVLSSSYMLAENSIPEKQAERYKETISAFDEFTEYYTENSKYMTNAKTIKQKAEVALNKLKNK
ncbi:MAG: outer membrane protein assembly factor BamD [Bacteroidota bacterium]